MSSLISKIDNDLIRNRPETWLSRIHYTVPAALVAILLTTIITILLPLTTNIYVVLTAVSIIVVGFYGLLVRSQFLYSDPNYTHRQLGRLFLLNVTSISLFICIGLIPYYVLTGKVSKTLKTNNFKSDARSIRIHMIPFEHIEFIKDGGLEPGTSIDTAKYKQSRQELTELILNNEFVKNDLADIQAFATEFATDTIAMMDTTAVTPIELDSARITDTVNSPLSLSDSAAGSSFSDDQNYKSDVDSPGTNNIAFQYDKYPLLREIREDFTLDQLKSMQSDYSLIIKRYDFSKYNGNFIDLGVINSYYKTINQESLNLYKTEKLHTSSLSLLFFVIMGIFLLAQLSVFILIKRRLFLAIIALICLSAWVILISLFQDLIGSQFYEISMMVLCGLYFLLILCSKFIFGKPFYKLFNLSQLYFINVFTHLFIATLTVFLIRFYLKHFLLSSEGFLEDADAYSLELYIVLPISQIAMYIALFLPINYQHFKAYQLFMKMPKK
jgi:hypothetical protein